MTIHIKKGSLASILTEGLSLGVVVVDTAYRIVFWNTWMEKQSSIRAREILGQNIFDKFPGIVERKKDRYIKQCIENGQPLLLSSYFHEYLIPLNIYKDEETGTMLQDVKIYPLGRERDRSDIVIIIEDVSNPVLHEKEILRLNRMLRGIRNVDQLIARVNSEKELFSGACKIVVEDIGYALAWIGLTEEGTFDVKPVAFAGIEPGLFEELKISYDDSEYGLGVTGRAIKTGKTQVVHSIQEDPFSRPWRDFARKAGYQSTCSMPLEVGGCVIGAMNVHSEKKNIFHGEELKLLDEVAGDISFGVASLRERQKRRQAEKALKESELKYRRHFENISDVVCSFDPELRITDISPSVEKMLGYRPEELIGRSYHELSIVAEPYRKQASLYTMRVLRGEDLTSVYQFIARDGSIKWAEIRSTAVAEAGRVVSVVSVVRDITERRRHEEEHNRLQAQLNQAQKMEAIGILAGGVAHDFNNLLTTIIGNAELSLMDLQKNAPVYSRMKDIRVAAHRAADLTRQLLAFSRKQIIQPKILDFNSLMMDFEKMLRRLIGEDIELVTVYAHDLWQVEADPGQLEQVIMNLAVNARDAMPKGGKLIIETANAELDEWYFRDHGVEECHEGAYVMLAVTDNGTGMDKEIQAHIFEPFYTTKGLGRGTGLGLSTVYGIVKQNRGHIWVYSEEGKGTTFKVYIPRARADIEVMEEEQSPQHSFAGSETILVVEDDEQLCNMARVMLEGYGYRVLTARSGKEAIKILGSHDDPIHLLLTDVVMPGMSGRDLAEQLQTIYSEIKVLYMSGYTDDIIADHGILEKDVDLIQKPFSKKELASKVREILDR
ncbi:MAG: PAS domain S-box protein [Deltaproteobacteria bacterium]|nr:PAS domain S-box protein [Deltaproteobacteria bacterium]